MGFIADALGFGGGGEEAGNTYQRLDQLYAGIDLPNYKAMEDELRGLIDQGMITPQQGQAILQERTGMETISTDPRLREAQMRALNELETIGEGGLRLSDKAALEKVAMDEAGRARGAREALATEARRRGVGGSGLEYGMKQQANQEAATRAAQRGMDIEAMAQDRALQSIMQAGQLGGQMQQQDWAQQAAAKQAQDNINSFNAAMKNQIAEGNRARAERAQYGNRDYRTNMVGAAQDRARQRFQDEMLRASGRAGAAQGLAGAQMEAGRSRDEFAGNLFNTGGAMLAAGMFSDINLKENIKPGEEAIDDFLGDLTVNEFEYKDPSMGKGKHYGPMAQDLEKNPVGKSMVEETPDGKMINYGKGQGVMLAILKNLSDRLDELEGTNA